MEDFHMWENIFPAPEKKMLAVMKHKINSYGSRALQEVDLARNHYLVGGRSFCWKTNQHTLARTKPRCENQENALVIE
jgi:hypothetical protein